VLDVNLVGSFVVSRVAATRLAAGSTLTLISSQAGRKGAAGWIAYCSSKFGVIGLGESLAQELAPAGVRVNVLCPGAIDAGMTPGLLEDVARAEGTTANAVRAGYLAGIPLGRLGTAEDVAGGCLLLASPFASFIAGSSLVIDGGELS
jgi:NAD(P)-dependent dehydrogenase (short-subunit alcohol dehydrogenase family)